MKAQRWQLALLWIGWQAVWLWSAAGAATASPADRYRGADEHFAARVESGALTCIGAMDRRSELVVTAEIVNDEFCDCVDGSDEPGTSACANGNFQCSLDGMTTATIPASWVNDGVCDCCDGSDEYQGRVDCPNVCSEKRAALHEQYKQQALQVRRGLEAKRLLVDSAEAARQERRRREAELNTGLKELQAQIAEAKRRRSLLTAAASKRRADEAAVETSDEGADAEEEASAAEAGDEGADGEANVEDRKDAAVVEDDEEGDTYDYDEYGDYEVHRKEEDAEEEEEEGARGGEESATSSSPSSSAKETDPAEEDLEGLCRQVYEDPSISSWIFWFRSQWQRLRSSLSDGGASPSMSPISTKLLSMCSERAEDEVDRLEAQQARLEREMREVRDANVEEQASSPAYAGLASRPIRNKVQQYEYELKLFQEVRQFEHGRAIGSLGKWRRLDHEGRQLYDNGAACWNGPKRSTRVTFVCGEDNEILDVQEPERCVYRMQVKTPAACEEAHAVDLESLTDAYAEAKDEL